MRNQGLLFLLFGVASAEKLIFEDNFDKLNFKTWQHELTMGGGGNNEFQWYTNNRTNSYVRDGVLYLLPTLTSDAIGIENLMERAEIWGGTPADQCTSNQFYGCERTPSTSVINPIRSARVRTANSFGFKFGRVEVSAQLPRGDWIWPAIWLLPVDQEYGSWPASGEIDIMEGRGNDESYPAGGVDSFGSTLHWGTDWTQNRFFLTHADYKHPSGLDQEFHTYGLYWDENRLYTYLDDRDNIVLDLDLSEQSFWERGDFEGRQNPWVGEENAAPFNREFYLIFNVAVGGTNDFFPDGMAGKPWNNGEPDSVNDFWNARDSWFSTWDGERAAMKIDSVKVWAFDDEAQE